MGIGPKTKCLHFSLTGYDLCFAKMGVKKKLEDISIKVSIEMRGMKAMVDFDPEELFAKETKTIQPPKKDESDPPGFYEIISDHCEFMRQILYHFGELPLDLSTKIRNRLNLMITGFYIMMKEIKNTYLTVMVNIFYAVDLMEGYRQQSMSVWSLDQNLARIKKRFH